MQDFLRAAESQGFPVTDDLQDLTIGHGAEHWLKWINRDTGRRSDAASAYLYATRAKYQNLHIQCNTKVDHVIIEDGVATGVITVPTRPVGGTDKIVRRTFRARKLIIVSGGTLSTPLILQGSGIGDPEKLKKVGIKPIIDLPGIGLNFQDHCLHFATYRATPGTASMGPTEGNSVVKHGVLDERLNVHGVKNFKVSDLSVCPDNIECNTFSTALLVGEKCSVLAAEDLGYSGDALEMKSPT